MSLTTTMPNIKPPLHSPTQSLTKSSHSRPSTTPRATSPPVFLGQARPPRLTPSARSPQAVQDLRTPSSGYFGFVIGDAPNPPDSNPGQQARQNWEYSSPQVRNAGTTPRPLAATDATPDREAFRRQPQQNYFDLSHGNTSSSRPSQSRQNSRPRLSARPSFDSPISPRSMQTSSPNPKTGKGLMDPEPSRSETRSFFDIPRRDSPAAISPPFRNVDDHRHARLSLPANSLHASKLQQAHRASRADTLPLALDENLPTLITPQQFAELLESGPQEVLLLDLRVSAQYATSRIRGALNLCIPTTLLKRPSFDVRKLENTFTAEPEREQFSRWQNCKYIVVYDSNSLQLKEAVMPINVLKKFSNEEWKGHGLIVRGGFAAMSRSIPEMIDEGQTGGGTKSSKAPLSIAPSASGVAPVAGGCPMPMSKTAANPFFGNIRQNMDLIGGVGQIPIKRPENLTRQAEEALPSWLRQVSIEHNEGKLVSERFLAIEKAEQKRMQEALSAHVSYGTPGGESSKPIQVAGIEKGSKNRYNNIFPYDHSRVRLQSVSTDGCDYINANHVKAAHSNKHYIATQAPIPSTFNDFWRVVWEQDVHVIVMLTAESEGGQLKSHPYWHTADYGSLRVKNLSEKLIPLEPVKLASRSVISTRPSIGPRRSTNPDLVGERGSVTDSRAPAPEAPFIMIRHFTVSHSAHPFQPMREVTQLHYSGWPDFGAPTDPAHLLGLIEETNKYVRGSSVPSSAIGPDQAAPEHQHPVIVHCSAGCGRTGTFCTVDSVIDMLKKQRSERGEGEGEEGMDVDSYEEWTKRDDVDLVADTVEDFRLQRLSMVQNLRQFVLCYESVLQWVTAQKSARLRLGPEITQRTRRGLAST